MDLILHEDERPSFEAYKSLMGSIQDNKEKYDRHKRLLSRKPKSSLFQKKNKMKFLAWETSKGKRLKYMGKRVKCVANMAR